ncbi:DUF4365 domain-containing protein [Microbacterium sp. P5_E9]
MKLQTDNQLKGRWGELIAAFAFPSHWIVRPLPYDYGIDLQVEVFEPVQSSTPPPKYKTTGGHLACQVKTTETLSFKDGSVSFPVDAADLSLAESMGASAPLLLLVAERASRRIFYLCLNDYVAKILEEQNSSWRSQSSVTLKLPQRNVLDLGDPDGIRLHWQYFKGLAYRAKLYAAVSAFVTASVDIDRALEDWVTRAPFQRDQLRDMQRSADEFDRALDVGLKAVDSAALVDLRDETSPYAGLFDSVRLARESIRAKYPSARQGLLNAAANTSDDQGFLDAQGAFELAANWSAKVFATAPTIGRIYEQTHREAGLRSEAIEYDVVR